MKIDVYNNKNEKAGTMEVTDGIFNAKWNPDLVHQALTVQLGNRRPTVAHAKGRSEVKGGGKKPWRQKGTGRARHGSIRSPLWKGGGVTHGPSTEKQYGGTLNRKMRRLAVASVLSKRLKDNEMKIIEGLNGESKKTKEFAAVLKAVAQQPINALVVAVSENRGVKRLTANMKGVDAISAKSLNVYDLLAHKNIIMEKGAVEEIEKTHAR